jgi:hypothetical protein
VFTKRTRLADHHPAVAAALAAVLPGQRAGAVRSVTADVARTCGVLDLCEAAADPDQLVAELDAAAAQARDDEEHGRPPAVATSSDEAFRRARAADAWRTAATATTDAALADALYEALHALGADTPAETHVIDSLPTP